VCEEGNDKYIGSTYNLTVFVCAAGFIDTHTRFLTHTQIHTHTLQLHDKIRTLSHAHSQALHVESLCVCSSTHTHSLPNTLTHKHTNTHSLSHTHTHMLSLSHTYTHTHTCSLSLSHTHTHVHTCSLSHTHTHWLSIFRVSIRLLNYEACG
jgi:hypothetical protein